MQNQAEVNFSKWHFNSQFSKVNFQKSTVKSPIQRSNVKGQKWNNDQSPIFQSPIGKDRFQTSNFKSSFQSQIFKAKFSKSNFQSSVQISIFKVDPSKRASNFQGQRQVIRAWFSKSTLFEKSNNSNSNTWKWNISKSNFDRQTFPSQVLQVNVFQFQHVQVNSHPSQLSQVNFVPFVLVVFPSWHVRLIPANQTLVLVRSRADKEEKVWFETGLQFAFFLSCLSQPRKLGTSASEELAFNPLGRPEDSRFRRGWGS